MKVTTSQYYNLFLSQTDIKNALATGLSFRNLIKLLKNKTSYEEVGKPTIERIHLIGKNELADKVKDFIVVLCS